MGEDTNEMLKTPVLRVKEEQQLQGKLSDLVKIRRHLINLIIMVMVWIASSFNYYLINFQMKYFQGNIFLNSSISSASEIVAILLGGLLYQKAGIRATLMAAFGISILGAIAIMIFGTYKNYIPLMVLSAKFGVSSTFNICYLATA